MIDILIKMDENTQARKASKSTNLNCDKLFLHVRSIFELSFTETQILNTAVRLGIKILLDPSS